MDWGHIALAVLLTVAVFARWRRRDRRSLDITFHWDKEHTDESDR